jgi:hypothetical protein
MKEFWIVLCLLVSATLTHAQTNDTSKSAAPAKAPRANSAALTEDELKLRERRAKARSLLVSLSSDARAFHDQMLRARSLARIADALWRVDTEQGRLLFRKAWEAAEVADHENDKKLQEEINRVKSITGGGYAINTPPNIRQEVLRLAARHERVLAEEFLEKYKAQKLEAANSPAKPNPNRLNEALSERIGVASQLLHIGETDRALELADPALSLVTMQTINFLSDVRDKNADAADKRYAALLNSSANNPQADANTVSLLASYIFTPRLLVTFTGGGGMSSSQNSPTITPAAVSPELRNAFYQAGGSILLRPSPGPGQPDQTSAGLDGKYLVIKRLLPFFEQGAAVETVEALRTHLNSLNSVVSEDTRRRDDDWVNRGLKSEKPATDREQYVLDRIERAKTSAERDRFYIELAYLMVNKGEWRARDYVSKVEDPDLRKRLQAYIDPSLAIHFVEKKNPDQALEMARKGELTHIHRAWVLTKCATMLAKTDRDKAMEVVAEAEAEARRIEGSDPALPRGLIAVANALKEIEPARVWDATFDAVKAANSAESFTGEDGELLLTFQSKGQSSARSSDAPEFDLDGIFKDLALKDYDRAVELARGFQGEGPRAVATIAIARAILEPKRR